MKLTQHDGIDYKRLPEVLNIKTGILKFSNRHKFKNSFVA